MNNASKSFVLNPKSVKRLNRDYSKLVFKLINQQTEEIFGKIESADELLMTRFLTLGVEDEHGQLAGAMTFHTSPNISSIPASEWENWLNNLYGLANAKTENIFWLHLVVFDLKYETFFARPILHFVFKSFLKLEALLLILPPGVNNMKSLSEFGRRIFPKTFDNPKNTQSIFFIDRDKIVFNYKIRRAVEEDNDDLVPLIDLRSKRFIELYGNYYIAELLTRYKDCGRHIVVAEYQGSAVSVMILNDIVAYDVLNEEFELTPFNGLRKRSDEDNIELDTLSQTEVIQTTEFCDETYDISSRKKFSTSFDQDDDYFVDVVDSESDYSIVITSSDLFVFDEDEEDERDNPNIPELITSLSSLEILKEMEKFKAYEVDPRLAYVNLMDKLSKSILSTHSKIGRIPVFCGKSNAFCIEVAAAHPDHEMSLLLVLETIYECFPDRDYAVICTPSSCRVEHWMTVFNRVAPRYNSNYPHDLLVCHKNSFLGQLECKFATKVHMPEVYSLLSTIPSHGIVLSHFEIFMEFENSPYQCFVFLCEDRVIGTAVLSEEFDIDFIDAQYNISPWAIKNCYKSGSFGVIESFVLSPIFHNNGEFFKRELHRMSEFDVLFYKHKASDRGSYKERPVISLLHWLQPVLPRKIPEIDFQMLAEEGYKMTDALIRRDHYALYITTISSSSMQKFSINTRVVIVGCSNTAYAFLESLILLQSNPNYMISFNNIILICAEGIHSKLSKKIKELFSVQKNFMTERYLDMISLRTYVGVVSGNLTQINRKDRYVVINDQTSLRYDYLFLMCGEKFQKPLHDYRIPFAENPENVFLINCPMDGNKAVIKLKQFQKGQYYEDKIIVYGHFLQAYSCLAGLLEYGIPGSKIAFVEPFPYRMNIDKKPIQNISVFNDSDIYNVTMDFIKAQGIEIFSSYYFLNWTYNPEVNLVTAVQFESKHKMLEMNSQAIFFFYEKSISPRIYQVINQAGLVFDGRLVIDNNCRTNDERIYGAGTLTKYSRKYYASKMVHKFFNRVEIGHKLGQQIRNMLVPGFIKRCEPKRHCWNFQLEVRDRLVPKYEKPILRYCRLPGGLYYLSIVKPGRRISLEAASSMGNYGQVFITGNCNQLDTRGFFKLHFNENNRVETITCLTKSPIDVKNLYCIWGKHEKLLNNLQLRYEMSLITDFFKYFKQPWAYAIYHDRFDDLLNELNDIMTSALGHDSECLITGIIEMYKQRKWQPLSTEQQEKLDDKFPDMLYSKIIGQKVLDFIQENLSYLPMYAHPIVVRNILEGFDKSPLFFK